MTWNNPTNAIIYIVSLTWEEVEEVYMVHSYKSICKVWKKKEENIAYCWSGH